MFWIILTTLVGVNVAPLVFFKLNIWGAQNFFIYLMVLGIFCWSLSKNLPLALFVFWVGLSTCAWLLSYKLRGQLNLTLTTQFFSFVCAVVLYQGIVKSVNSLNIDKIINVLRYVVIVELIFCTLQFFGYSQFFALLQPDSKHFNNLVVGFIGQPTFLAGLLAMSAPLFFIKRNLTDILSLILLTLVLFITGTTKGDPSSTGFLVMGMVILYYSFYVSKKIFYIILFGMIVIGLGLLFLLPKDIINLMFNSHGRFGLWVYYLDLFKQMPITGGGLGTVINIAEKTPFPRAHQLHMEFFQLAFELGLVGLCLFGNMILDFFKIKHVNETELALKTIFLGFLVYSCFLFPAHLWLTSSLAIFAYAGMYAMKEERHAGINSTPNQKSGFIYN